LKINESKTKDMIAAENDRTIRDVGQSVAFGDKTFEIVKAFVHLRSLATPKNEVSLEIHRRNQTANRCLFGLRKQLQSNHLSRPTKYIIYKTLIRPDMKVEREESVTRNYTEKSKSITLND
jgi:hypothetical protein